MNRPASFVQLLAAFLAVAALSNCTGNNTGGTSAVGASAVSPSVVADSPPNNEISAGEATAETSSLPPPDGPRLEAASADYRIGPQDTLQVTVYQVPDLTAAIQVDGAGNITMPLIGEVRVAGLTTDAAGKAISAKLGKTYLQKPQVFVALRQSAQRIIVSGGVIKPVALPASGGFTLSQAIVAAGGMSEVGNPNRVHIARVSGQKVRDAVFDLEAILAGKAQDPNVYGGDMIVAENSGTRVALKNVKDLLPFTAFAALVGGF